MAKRNGQNVFDTESRNKKPRPSPGKYTAPSGYCHLDNLPVELQLNIMKQLDSVDTLQRLTKASTRISHVFEQYFLEIVRIVLESSITEELQHLVFAIISARNMHPGAIHEDKWLESFLDHHLNPESRGGLSLPEVVEPVDVLKEIVNLLSDVAYFVTRFFETTLSILEPFNEDYFGPDQQDPPISSTELHRMMRSFLTFELYSDLFRRSNFPEGSQGYDNGIKQQQKFLKRLCPWEVEGLKNIFDQLVLFLYDPIVRGDYEYFSINPDFSQGLGHLRRLFLGLDRVQLGPFIPDGSIFYQASKKHLFDIILNYDIDSDLYRLRLRKTWPSSPRNTHQCTDAYRINVELGWFLETLSDCTDDPEEKAALFAFYFFDRKRIQSWYWLIRAKCLSQEDAREMILKESDSYDGLEVDDMGSQRWRMWILYCIDN
ncbi:MAG: hypothetical protein M1834_003199 [Cirrosporium novae-zelandiae]|nr:MAG: hypothetical protein M1834_003199 [Cirrosporium novae-zelandiae]